MSDNKNRAVVFMLFGQSNAVGHGIPMKDEDRITVPLKNVFGLSRELNQSYNNTRLDWSGYLSAGMNLAEEQDDTYSVANCLARRWQDALDAGRDLPDLYIIQIAIGAQGVTEQFMWYPERAPKLVPGPLGTVDISLYPFALRILMLVGASFRELGKTPEFLMHWRGGEEDTTVHVEQLEGVLEGIYLRMFNGFYSALGTKFPIVLHYMPFYERSMEMDPSGEEWRSMQYIDAMFEKLVREHDNISLFDPRRAPFYVPDTREHNLYIEDAVHYTPEVNDWVASEIMKGF